MATKHLPVFQQTLEKSERWIHDVAEKLDWLDQQRAYKALRAVLHTLRDQLTIEEATDLSAQMPMLIRGLFFEGWNPARRTEKLRQVEDFTDKVNKHFSDIDVADLWEPEDITRAVFGVLAENVSAGEISDVVASLPKKLQELWG